jgi:putative acetyltransferase
MSEIVIRHAEPKDAEAIRQIICIRRCITTRYNYLILPLSIGRNALALSLAKNAWWPASTKNRRRSGASGEASARSHVAFGISVAAQAQGRGVGSALMREMINRQLDAHRRIELTVFADNPRWRCTGNLVSKLRAPAKKFALRNGEYVDAYYMARMKTHSLTPALSP